jgi:hypothetical protein
MRTLGMAGALALVLVACGGDNGGEGGGGRDAIAAEGEAGRYIDALADEVARPGEVPIDDELAECTAIALVNLIGVDVLIEAGISPKEFFDAGTLSALDLEVTIDAARLGEALSECNVAAQTTKAMAPGFVELGTELPPEARACLEDNVGLQEAAITDAMARFFIDGSTEGARAVMIHALVACPAVPTAVIISQTPPEETPETEACLLDFIRDNPDANVAFFDQDAAALRQIGTQLRTACPAFGGG